MDCCKEEEAKLRIREFDEEERQASIVRERMNHEDMSNQIIHEGWETNSLLQATTTLCKKVCVPSIHDITPQGI